MGKFKVGDRVRVTRDICDWPTTGLRGTIRKLSWDGFEVDTDESFYASGFGGGERNWVWCYAKDLELIDPNKPEKQPVIVITSDGKTTTATKRIGKKVICSATARCSDDDTFDFNTGAELAFQRLREKEKPVPKGTPWPKRVVCVEAHAYPEDFCIGRTYNVDWRGDFGLLRLKDGSSWGICKDSDTDFRVNMFPNYARFIPLVED